MSMSPLLDMEDEIVAYISKLKCCGWSMVHLEFHHEVVGVPDETVLNYRPQPAMKMRCST